MKNVLKISLLLSFLMAVNVGFAQEASRSEQKAKKLTEGMHRQLNLTEDQQAKVMEINLNYTLKKQKLRQDQNEEKEVQQALIKSLKVDRVTALKEVLSEEQFQKMKEHMEQRSMHPGPGPMRKGRERPDFEARKKLHQEMKAYLEEEVYPVLKVQRNKLDLKRREQKAIEELKELKAEIIKLRKNMQKEKKSGEKISAESRELMQALLKKRGDLMKTVYTIAADNDDEIQELFNEISSEREVWKEDIIHILSEHKTRYNSEKADKLIARLQKVSPVAFLLMEFNADEAINAANRQARETQVYPNPAKDVSTIQYEVREAGPVRIEVLNKDGQLIKKVLDETQNKGKYTLTIDLAGMRNSFYYYVITDAEGSSTHRFLIQNVK